VSVPRLRGALARLAPFRRALTWRWLLAPALIAAVPAHAGTVALTFDDLPVFGPYKTAEGQRITTKLLAGIRRHHWRAIGFVNEIQLDGPDRTQRIALLRQWLDDGFDLGNHSYSHFSLNHTPVNAYIADVAKGEIVTKELLAARGRTERWYRYPYLETGLTLKVRHQFESWLVGHGYRVAPVTMENSDWEFAEPYADALAHGRTAQAAHIRRAYLAFTARIVPWYQKAAQQLLGRQPAFVFLLHASRLNADSIDQLAAILRANHLRSVTLDEAMKDPAYRIPDTYAGPDGDEWLTRWSMTLHKDLPYASLPEVPADVAALDEALENAPPPASRAPAPAKGG
jgi:peptidoglycan/xylan/chitin deacetylase (PgdA/CDA1 family)